MNKMDGVPWKQLKNMKNTCCIFYITFYDIDPKAVTTNQLRKEVLDNILKKLNQSINITLATPFTKE
jgi:uncharacterized protein with HEPN domain